jgi:hypothetical protein
MRNVTVEDVNELQTTLLQLHTLIDERAPYNLAEDVVQNLQGHLQRTVASTEEFASSGATTGMTTTDTTTTADSGATTPFIVFNPNKEPISKWAQGGLNPWPTGYEPVALPG